MGLKAIKATKPEELSSKMKEMLEYNDGPILMEVVVDRKVPVLPMVPGGKGLHEFLVYDAGKIFNPDIYFQISANRLIEKEKMRRKVMKERSGH